MLEALHAHDIVCRLSSPDEGFDRGLFDPSGIEPATVQVLACGLHDGFASVDPAHVVVLTSSLSAPLALTAWIAVAGVAVAPMFLFLPGVAQPTANWLYRRLSRGEAPEGLKVFFDALRNQLGVALLVPLLVTVGAFLINYVQAWLVAYAFGMAPSFADVVAVVAISSLLSLLPISVSGVGVREAFLALIFPAAFGLSETLGIAFGLGVFSVIYLPALAVGFVAWQAWPPSS